MDDTLRKVLQEKEDLVKKIGVLEKEKNSYQKMVDARDEEIDKIKQSYSDIDDKLKEVEDLREKAKLYDSLQESRKNELIKELAGDNDDLADNYSSFTYEQLKFLNENKTPNNPGHGIKPPVARGLDLNGESVPSNDEYTDEMFKEDYLALFGEKI